MSDNLTKDISREAYGAQDAISPVPPTPAYCHDVITSTPSYLTYYYDRGDGVITSITVSNGTVDTATEVCSAATAGDPGSPGIRATTTTSYNLGWTGAAISVDDIAGDGQFQFSVREDSIGVVCGLNDTNVGAGYIEIDYAIYCTNMQYVVIEKGVTRTAPASFTTSDVFTIRRLGTEVAYFKGSTLVYTSEVASTGTLFADCSMYSGGDEISLPSLSAAVSSTFAANTGGSAYGVLQNLRGFSTDSTIADGGGVFSDPPSGTSDPGGGPGTDAGTDSSGDWPGRLGGILRSLVGTAESYNEGSVTTGGGAGSGGTGSLPDGDYTGRSGNQLRGLVGEAYGSSDPFGTPDPGTNYAICAGRLNDPSAAGSEGITGTGEGGMLQPQFAICDGVLTPVSGFGIGLVGMVGTVAGVLGQLHGFAAESDYASVGSGDNGGSGSDPSTGEGGGSGGINATGDGDYAGRIGGELRGLVGVAIGSQGAAQLFLDNFTGTGTLASHNPDTGAPYTIDGSGSTSSYVLDGTGGLPSAPTGAGVLDSAIEPATETWTLTETFTVTAAGTDTVNLQLGTADSTTGVDLVTATLVYDGTDWTLTLIVRDETGAVLDTISTTVTLSEDVAHTLTIVATPSGTTVRLDDVAVLISSATPGTQPDTVVFSNTHSGSTSSVTIDSIALVEEVPNHAGAILENTEPSRLVSFAHTEYSAPGTSRYGVDATHSGDYTLAAYCGAVSENDLPTATLSASATTTILATSSGTLPVGTLSATASATHLVGVSRTHGGHYTVSASCGAVSTGSLPRPSFISTTTGVSLARATGTLPRGTLAATATAGLVARASGTLPALRPVSSGVVVATLPRGTLSASASIDVTVEYEAYSVTLTTDARGAPITATTHYTNFPFNQILRFGSTYYGVAADGLYALEGDDFDGTPIVSTVATGTTDHGSSGLKRAISLYLSGRVGADMDVSVVSAELDTNRYTYRPRREGAGTYRAVFGKGIRAQYWSYQFTNTLGEDFTLEGMAPEVATLRRTL